MTNHTRDAAKHTRILVLKNTSFQKTKVFLNIGEFVWYNTISAFQACCWYCCFPFKINLNIKSVTRYDVIKNFCTVFSQTMGKLVFLHSG